MTSCWRELLEAFDPTRRGGLQLSLRLHDVEYLVQSLPVSPESTRILQSIDAGLRGAFSPGHPEAEPLRGMIQKRLGGSSR